MTSDTATSSPQHEVTVHVTFRNTDPTEALRGYAEEKIANAVKKFVHHETQVHIVLLVEKNRHIAEVDLHADGADFKCSEESADLYASIDLLATKIATQLRKHKEKITKHH